MRQILDPLYQQFLLLRMACTAKLARLWYHLVLHLANNAETWRLLEAKHPKGEFLKLHPQLTHRPWYLLRSTSWQF